MPVEQQEVHGREALVDRNPDFVIYSRYIGHWEDGTPLEAEEKESIFREVLAEAARLDIRDRVEGEATAR